MDCSIAKYNGSDVIRIPVTRVTNQVPKPTELSQYPHTSVTHTGQVQSSECVESWSWKQCNDQGHHIYT